MGVPKMAFSGVSLNPRPSIASSASRPSYDENAEEELTENCQLYRIREISNRIAHEKAQRKSFCKYNQIRKIRIQLLGAKNDTSFIKKLKPTTHRLYSNYDNEKALNSKVSDGWDGSDKELSRHRKLGLGNCSTEPFESLDKQISPALVGNKKFNIQRNSWVGSENDNHSTNDDLSQKTMERNKVGRWTSIANRFRSGQFHHKGMGKNQRIQSGATPLSQEDTPSNVQRDRKESLESNDINKGQASLKYQNKGRFPRLKHAEIKAFEDLDPILVKEETLKVRPDGGNVPDQGTRKSSLLISTTKGMFPSFGDKRKSLTTSEGIVHLNVGKSNPEISLDDERKRRKSLYQSRILAQFQDRKSFSQQQRTSIDEKMNSKFQFSTNGRTAQRRLSDEFRMLESCRYLRIYKMK